MKKLLATLALSLLTFSAAIATEPAKIDNTGKWTDLEVKKLCHYRAENDRQNAKRFDICMKRNQNKVGKTKQAGEANELNLADQRLAAKVAAKKP